MTRVAFVADVHLANHRRFGGLAESGINRRARLVLGTLEAAGRMATDAGCSLFLVLGDLFDTERPTPQLVAAAQAALPRMRCVVLAGNHDVASSAPGDHALGPLAPVAEVVDSPRILVHEDCALALVPYLPGSADELVPTALAQLLARRRPRLPTLLGFHAGIRDKETPVFLEGAQDSIEVGRLYEAMVECRVWSAAAGNWHDRRRWDFDALDDRARAEVVVQILQVGTLCPTGFDNALGLAQLALGEDPYGWLGIWDSATGELSSLQVPGPRFFVADGLDELRELVDSCSGRIEWPGPSFLLVRVAPDEAQAARGVIEGLVVRGVFEAGDFEIDRQSRREQAASAAQAARRSETLVEALAAFVKRAPFEGSVDRMRVLARAKNYLKL